MLFDQLGLGTGEYAVVQMITSACLGCDQCAAVGVAGSGGGQKEGIATTDPRKRTGECLFCCSLTLERNLLKEFFNLVMS